MKEIQLSTMPALKTVKASHVDIILCTFKFPKAEQQLAENIHRKNFNYQK